MESAALELQAKIDCQDEALSGTVRVTSTDSIAIDFLIPAVAALHEAHPGIRVDLEASTQMLNLTQRQADIAIRYLDGGKGLTLLDEPARQGRIAAALNSSLLVRRAVAAGLGIGEMPVYMGEQEGLTRIWPGRTRRADYEVWLVTHPDLRGTARVRTVAEFLTAAIQGAAD